MKIESFINLAAVAVIAAHLGCKVQENKDIQELDNWLSYILPKIKNEKPSYRKYDDYYTARKRPLVAQEIVVYSKKEGEEVLATMDKLLHEYSQVSIADFYYLLGVPTEFSDHQTGWKELSHAGLKGGRYGYTFVLPKPVDLD